MFNFPSGIILTLLALVLCIDIHECAHAWTAYQLGDSTARNLGRVTLNPIAHLDPTGTILMVISVASGFGIGWGKPVPVNPYNLRSSTPAVGMGLVALAGPVSNLLFALLLAIPVRLGLGLPLIVGYFLQLAVLVNVSLAVFNLIPIFPLDGYNVLVAILDSIRATWANSWKVALFRMRESGPAIFFILILADQFLRLGLFGKIIGFPVLTLSRLILG
ncbi:MAG: site-2 protease family protein [Chloroflexi bacterium]|nr:site-2 protease family protein [Chloroflexota bacterium]